MNTNEVLNELEHIVRTESTRKELPVLSREESEQYEKIMVLNALGGDIESLQKAISYRD